MATISLETVGDDNLSLVANDCYICLVCNYFVTETNYWNLLLPFIMKTVKLGQDGQVSWPLQSYINFICLILIKNKVTWI